MIQNLFENNRKVKNCWNQAPDPVVHWKLLNLFATALAEQPCIHRNQDAVFIEEPIGTNHCWVASWKKFMNESKGHKTLFVDMFLTPYSRTTFGFEKTVTRIDIKQTSGFVLVRACQTQSVFKTVLFQDLVNLPMFGVWQTGSTWTQDFSSSLVRNILNLIASRGRFKILRIRGKEGQGPRPNARFTMKGENKVCLRVAGRTM